ncbi:MAG: 16S rRNA (uracil1498-N3)-methyltransferase [Glaciecola sp.]|jgi:16S rRNA (uracil1498-N3)-methyltransferase
MAARSPFDRSRERRFFLDPSAPTGQPRLADQELHHALHVNRLGQGDQLWGLDGAGSARLLEITAATRRDLTLRPLGEIQTCQPAGSPGAPLIHLEVGLSMPKPGKAEEMVDRLTQIGVARLQPLIFQHSAEHARTPSKGRMEKLQRASREAMKQCLRLWPMEIATPISLQDWLHADAHTIVLDPLSEKSLLERLSYSSPTSHLRLLIGPEGGFQASEIECAKERGAEPASLRGHVLRIETAAEIGAGIALQLCDPI